MIRWNTRQHSVAFSHLQSYKKFIVQKICSYVSSYRFKYNTPAEKKKSSYKHNSKIRITQLEEEGKESLADFILAFFL